MSELLTQLKDLQARLHEVNEGITLAAQPLDRLSEMNDKQRDQLAKELRAALARWEEVTQQISQALRTPVNALPPTDRGIPSACAAERQAES